MNDNADAARWCMLRTNGARTLKLADSLCASGVDAWTPRRTFKRAKPGRCALIDGRKPTIEIQAPILPTFVFARATHLTDLAFAAGDPASRHPAFSVFLHAGRVPLVADRDVVGLQDEERRATDALMRMRETEDREATRRIRAMEAVGERARRKALQAERSFTAGDLVTIDNAPGFAGMSGIVESSDGKSAVVLFGGALTMKIEAWQLSPDPVGAGLS